MIPKGVGGNIRITVPRELAVRAGEVMTLHVIKRLATGKWAVGILGKVYPARSDLDLQPGMSLRARTAVHGSMLVLTIENAVPDSSAAALMRQGLPGGAITHLIAAALLRSGLPVTADSVERIKGLLARTKMPKERAARAYAALLDKGIEITSPGAEKIAEAFGFGERGGADHHGYRGKGFPRDAESFRRMVADGSTDPGCVAAFNHLKAGNQSWVVLPFLFVEGEERYPGTLKLLYDPYLQRTRSLALTVAPQGGPSLSFYLTLEGKKRMTVFCADRRIRRALQGSLGNLASKVQNLGFEVDDTIHGEESFDGFSPIWEGAMAREVDTLG